MMKYSQIAGSQAINAGIYCYFEYISEKDAEKFVKKFSSQDDEQAMHTFRELVLGAYLASNGFRVKYECIDDPEHPDWCILDEASKLSGIVEVANFHIRRETENDIKEKLQAGGVWLGDKHIPPIDQAKEPEVGTVFYWRDKVSDKDDTKHNIFRLWQAIDCKASKYRKLVKRRSVPYIIAVFGESLAAIDLEEIRYCLFAEDGIFKAYPEVSGVLYLEGSPERYSVNFERTSNPNALGVDLPSGEF